jgi:hypothetical protein
LPIANKAAHSAAPMMRGSCERQRAYSCSTVSTARSFSSQARSSERATRRFSGSTCHTGVVLALPRSEPARDARSIAAPAVGSLPQVAPPPQSRSRSDPAPRLRGGHARPARRPAAIGPAAIDGIVGLWSAVAQAHATSTAAADRDPLQQGRALARHAGVPRLIAARVV